MAPSGKNSFWVGGGHGCDIWFLGRQLRAVVRSSLFLFGNRSPPCGNCGLLFCGNPASPRFYRTLLCFRRLFLLSFGHLCVPVSYFAGFFPWRASLFDLLRVASFSFCAFASPRSLLTSWGWLLFLVMGPWRDLPVRLLRLRCIRNPPRPPGLFPNRIRARHCPRARHCCKNCFN